MYLRIIYKKSNDKQKEEVINTWLRKYNYGDNLLDNYKDLIDLYRNYITCYVSLEKDKIQK